MSEGAVVLLASLVLVWSLVSGALGRIGLTGPIVFLAAGIVVANGRFDAIRVGIDSETVHVIAEITLALVLFADASTVEPRQLFRDAAWPARLLGIGLPLALLLGTGAGLLLLDGVPWEAAALAAAALVATDAALSRAVVEDPRLPEPIRVALNVESGLNDGLATPFVALFIAGTASALGTAGHRGVPSSVASALGDLVVGVVGGAVIGWLGGRALTAADRRGWTAAGGRLAVLALAVLVFASVSALSGNGFVAAFVGGIAFAAATRGREDAAVEYPELLSEVLAWVTWFVFGAALVAKYLDGARASVFVYALLSLTVVRMVPVALALIGASADRASVLFLGWFGPRGLASVVFAVLIAEELPTHDGAVHTVIATITATIVASVVLHGITASPFVRRFLRAERGRIPGT